MYKTPASALSSVATALRKYEAAPTFAKGRAVLAACDRARDTFDAQYWPDNWSAIQRAADDVAPGARYYGQ